MARIIFGGKNIEISLEGLSESISKHTISNCLKEYDHYDLQKNTDAIIQISTNTELELLASNPATHFEIENGFGMQIPRFGRVFYVSNTVPKIIYEPDKFRISKNYLYKIIDKEFKHPYEYFCQIIHELILVPGTILLFNDLIAVHGSAVLDSNTEEIFVFSGSGGVGKTFLEMSLILNDGYEFFADDMIIIGDGFVGYPNLAPPKIYKYNVAHLPILEKYINENYNFINRLHWKLYPHIPYMGKYCRRVLPVKLFRKKSLNCAEIKEFIILFKENRDSIKVQSIDGKKAANLSFQIIKAEYSKLFTHIHYHIFNRLGMGEEPIFTEEDVKSKYRRIFNSPDAKYTLIRMPMNINATELYKFIRISFNYS